MADPDDPLLDPYGNPSARQASVLVGATRRCPLCTDGVTKQVAEGPEGRSAVATVWRCRANPDHTELIGVACQRCGNPASDQMSRSSALCKSCIDVLGFAEEDDLADLFDGWTPPLTDEAERRTIYERCRKRVRVTS
jgi:hypothetical protein